MDTVTPATALEPSLSPQEPREPPRPSTDALTVAHLAEVLQEPNTVLLRQVLQHFGEGVCTELLTTTLQAEASGGMLTAAGDRRRSSGGVFFHLTRQRCTPAERRRLFPYTPDRVQRPTGKPAAVPPAPVTLDFTLWKGLTPMAVTATLKLVLREMPDTMERGGMVYMTLTNEPRGVPKNITLDSGPLFLAAPVKQWRTACTKAEQIRATGVPALLIVEAHVSTKDNALVGVVKGVQVVEGKAAVQPAQS